MLDAIGVASLTDLFHSIPEKFRLDAPLNLPPALSESELVDELGRLAAKNGVDECTSFVGAGIYAHYAPVVIDHVLRRSEFYTAYTPYQPEVSQGTLQALFEYQTLVSLLLETEVTNASLYDGATGCAEAALMARRLQRKRSKVLLTRGVHPDFRHVTRTYMVNFQNDLGEVAFGPDGRVDMADLKAKLGADTAAVIVGHPNYFGVLEDLPALVKTVHDAGALLVVTFGEPLAFGLLPGPGRYGVDIVAGEGQSFLGAPNYGGPSLGLFSTKEEFVRQMPGRVCGMTADADGRRGFVLTLSTREQHIRREKATSNICTNQGLCALAATVFLTVMGKQGLRRLAELNLNKAHYLKQKLSALDGYEIAFAGPTFNEFVLRCRRKPAAEARAKLLEKHRILAGVELSADYPELESHLLLNATEAHRKADLDALVSALATV